MPLSETGMKKKNLFYDKLLLKVYKSKFILKLFTIEYKFVPLNPLLTFLLCNTKVDEILSCLWLRKFISNFPKVSLRSTKVNLIAWQYNQRWHAISLITLKLNVIHLMMATFYIRHYSYMKSRKDCRHKYMARIDV